MKTNIITAHYNTPKDLWEKSLASVDSQTCNDFTQIIVDDGSNNTENFMSALENASKDINRKFVRLDKNSGPGAARNAALKLLEVDCQYICLLDSDDKLEPNSIEIRSNYLDNNPNIIAVYGNKYNEVNGQKTLDIGEPYNEQILQQRCIISSCSIMWRREPFMKYIKTLKEDIRLCEDWLVWRKLAFLGRISKIDTPMYTQVLHGANLTMNKDVLRNHYPDYIKSEEDYRRWIQTI